MKAYRVVWECEIDAKSPEAAARIAQSWMEGGDALWSFDVFDSDGVQTVVDLDVEDRDFEP